MQKEIKKEDDFGIEEIVLHPQKGDAEKVQRQTEKYSDEDMPEEKVDPIKEIFGMLGTLVVTVAAVLFLTKFIIINAYVPSGSMENTIMPGNRLIGSRLAYLFDEPQRGDVVIFKYPDDETQLFVKRIIGLPGETITVEEAKVYIGQERELLDESYLKEEWTVDTGPYTFEVPEDCYLVLGDNRNNSKDSRYWINTYVKKETILGEALFVYWPFENLGKLN